MAKIKFTKTELKKQQDNKKQFERFLPTLQLKKQQLQMEVRQSAEALEENLREQRRLEKELAVCIAFFGDAAVSELVSSNVVISRVVTGTANIAGINIPTFDHVEFEPQHIDLMTTDWYVDDALAALKSAASLREAHRVLQVQYDLLAAELRTTSQRVNLFEKVKIPECKENIRRICIFLGDMNTSAVARCKIAKGKAEERAS